MFSTTIIKNTNNKRVQKNKIVQQFPEHPNDKYVELQTPMRLDEMAYNEYGDAKHWRILAVANELTTLFVTAGDIIRIPHSPNLKYVKD